MTDGTLDSSGRGSYFSGSGSEPPANPREKWPPCPVDTPRCKHGRKPPVSGPSCPECAAERAGSPPVGPLQALREAITGERFAGSDRDVRATARHNTDLLLESLQEQLAALQRERDDLKVENARMRPWYPKTEVGGGSSPSYPKGDAVPSAPQTQEET